MKLLEKTIAQISAPHPGPAAIARKKLEQAMADPRALGELYPLILKYISATGSAKPELPQKCLIICCADHGVAELKVSAYPQETTLQMTKNYLFSKGSVANALANFTDAELLTVDLGIAALKEPLPELLNRRIAAGTKNFTLGPAMTREQAVQALETGIELAVTCVKNGFTCILPAEMGIANTTSSSAICAAICGMTAEEITGRGTSISDERLAVKIEAVKTALRVNQPDPADGIDVLAKVGGFEFGCIAGIILGAASAGAVVGIDGFNTAAAGIIAQAICPEVVHYLLGSHLAAMPQHRTVLARLGITPYMDLKFKLGEATGSSITADLLDASILAYNALVRPGQSKSAGVVCVLPHVMPAEADQVSGRVLDSFLDDFPQLNRAAMEACRNRLDHLAKPICSLGYLEEIAIELAGIIEEKQPPTGLNRTLVCFAESNPYGEYGQLLAAFTHHADAKCLLSLLRPGQPPTAGWAYGCQLAEEIAESDDLIGFSIHHEDAPLIKDLLNPDGSLRYRADEFLAHLPDSLKIYASVLTGAMLGAARKRLLIVLDNEPVDILGRYIEALVPAVRPFVLHVQPQLLQLGITTDAGAVACLGFRLVDAALHILNDMKTFAECEVATAVDGIGKDRQS